MPKRKNVFFDPKFNEWLFDYIINLKADHTKNLNQYELRMIRNVTALKRFCANENLEKKLSLLSKVGLEWNVSFFPTAQIAAELVRKVYTQLSMKGKTVDFIEEMMRQKVFVLNSRDMAISMSLMSLNSHSEVYVINPAFLSFKRDIKASKSANISTKLGMAAKNMNVKHDEVLRGTKNLVRLTLESNRIEDYISSQFALQMLDVMILWLLYTTPYNYVSVDYIKRELGSKYKPASVGIRCAHLFRERKMIDKRPSQEDVMSYLITQEGITTIGMINNLLLNRVYAQ